MHKFFRQSRHQIADSNQNVRFLLKNGHFWPLQESPLKGEKILTFQTWLKKSIVFPSWVQGAKLAWKMPFKGWIWPNVWFLFQNDHFRPLSESPLLVEIILTYYIWLKKHPVLSSLSQGARLAWIMPFRVIKMAKYAILA